MCMCFGSSMNDPWEKCLLQSCSLKNVSSKIHVIDVFRHYGVPTTAVPAFAPTAFIFWKLWWRRRRRWKMMPTDRSILFLLTVFSFPFLCVPIPCKKPLCIYIPGLVLICNLFLFSKPHIWVLVLVFKERSSQKESCLGLSDAIEGHTVVMRFVVVSPQWDCWHGDWIDSDMDVNMNICVNATILHFRWNI